MACLVDRRLETTGTLRKAINKARLTCSSLRMYTPEDKDYKDDQGICQLLNGPYVSALHFFQ